MDHSFLIHNNMIIQFSSFHLLPSLSLFQIFSFSGGLRILFVKLVFAIFKSMKKKALIVSELDSREQRHQWQNLFFFFLWQSHDPSFWVCPRTANQWTRGISTYGSQQPSWNKKLVMGGLLHWHLLVGRWPQSIWYTSFDSNRSFWSLKYPF